MTMTESNVVKQCRQRNRDKKQDMYSVKEDI